jgi:hypothetical protein
MQSRYYRPVKRRLNRIPASWSSGFRAYPRSGKTFNHGWTERGNGRNQTTGRPPQALAAWHFSKHIPCTMPYTKTITITDQKTNQETKVTAEFEDDELDILHAYCSYVKELSLAKILQSNLNLNFTLKLPNNGPVSCTQTLPPEDDIIVLLFRLRPLILNDEHASFNRVTGIIGKKLSDSNVRLFLKAQQSLFGGKRSQSLIEVKSHNQIINSDKVLSDWLNAFQYHRDQSKRKEIERLHELMPLESTRGFFIMLLLDKVEAIFNIAGMIELLLGKRKTLQYP